MKKKLPFLLCFACALLLPVGAEELPAPPKIEPVEIEAFWDFGATGALASNAVLRIPGSLVPVTNDLSFTISDLSRMNGGADSIALVTTGSASQPPFSGGGNAGAYVPPGTVFSYNAPHFRWFIAPTNSAAPFSITLTHCSFATRSTTTGPVAWSLHAFTNGVEIAVLGTGSMVANTAVTTYDPKSTPPLNLPITSAVPLEFRLCGYNNNTTSNTSVNWRIDDLSIKFLYDETVEVPLMLHPPALKAVGVTTTSITLSWQDVELATEGYRLDASRSPTFIEDITLSSCVYGGIDVGGWEMTPLQFTDSGTSTLLFNQGNVLVSSPIDLTGILNARFLFNARTFNGVDNNSNYIQVDIHDGASWAYFGSFTPTTSTITAHLADMSLAAYADKNIRLRVTAPNFVYSGSLWRGVAINNIRVQLLDVDGYIAPFEDGEVASPPVVIDGLTPNTTYYFRGRSVGDEGETTGNSGLLAVTTLDDTLAPVELLAPGLSKHDAATLRWEPHPDATGGYQIEVYQTNTTSKIAGACVIISKTFMGSGNNHAVELTNVGNEPADLWQYDLRRGNIGSNWSITPVAELHAGAYANNALRQLAPGQSILVIHEDATHAGLNTLPAIRFKSRALEFKDGNIIGLFRHQGPQADAARVDTSAVYNRVPIVSAGRLVVDDTEWGKETIPAGPDADYTPLGLLRHMCAVPHFPETTRSVGPSTTHLDLANLRARRTYTYRVRAIGDGAYSPWSDSEFTAIEPPKNTIFMVR